MIFCPVSGNMMHQAKLSARLSTKKMAEKRGSSHRSCRRKTRLKIFDKIAWHVPHLNYHCLHSSDNASRLFTEGYRDMMMQHREERQKRAPVSRFRVAANISRSVLNGGGAQTPRDCGDDSEVTVYILSLVTNDNYFLYMIEGCCNRIRSCIGVGCNDMEVDRNR